MKYFACSDIHGNYKALMSGIEKAGYDKSNKEHQLIVCGDMFGRAANCSTDIINVYRYLTSDEHINKPIIIQGNHELILIDALERGYLSYLDCRNGEDRTLAALADEDLYYARQDKNISKAVLDNYPEFLEWLKSLPKYYETSNHIITHGWIPRSAHPETYKDATEREWYNAMWCDTDDELYCMSKMFPNGYHKTLVVGHWGTYRLRKQSYLTDSHDIYVNEQLKVIGLDNTTVFSQKIEFYIFEE